MDPVSYIATIINIHKIINKRRSLNFFVIALDNPITPILSYYIKSAISYIKNSFNIIITLLLTINYNKPIITTICPKCKLISDRMIYELVSKRIAANKFIIFDY